MKNYLTMNQMVSSFERTYNQWARIHSILNVVGLFLVVAYDMPYLWIIPVIFSFAWFVKEYCSFTYANFVTLTRLIIIIALGLLHSHLSDTILFIGFLVAILMDGLDGYLARKFNQSTKSGETLDMETDSFLVLAMTWIHFESDRIGILFLIPGSLRYTYEIIFFWLEPSSADYPPKKVRATIAVLFFMALLVPFIYNTSLSVLMIASCLVLISFGTSLFYQLKNYIYKKH